MCTAQGLHDCVLSGQVCDSVWKWLPLHLSSPYVNNWWLVFALLIADIDRSISEEAAQVGAVTLRSGLDNPAIT